MAKVPVNLRIEESLHERVMSLAEPSESKTAVYTRIIEAGASEPEQEEEKASANEWERKLYEERIAELKEHIAKLEQHLESAELTLSKATDEAAEANKAMRESVKSLNQQQQAAAIIEAGKYGLLQTSGTQLSNMSLFDFFRARKEERKARKGE